MLTTRNDVLDDIRFAIEATGEVPNADTEYDLDAIADAGYTHNPTGPGYLPTVNTEDFWALVVANQLHTLP